MVLQTTTIARNTFVESIRQPIYMVIILLCGVLLFFTTWGTGFSMGYSSSAEVSGDNKLLLDVGLATVFVCGMLLSAFVSTAAVSREIENKTVLTVVSKPISRTSVILGKYVGVAMAMLVAVIPMLLFLLMGIRHGVLTTAADDPDQPVLVFTCSAIALSLGVAAWCNFFYGWPFTQTVVLTMVPLLIIAYLLVLLIGKEWNIQMGMLEYDVMDGNRPTGFKERRFTLPTKDFKPQILLASGVLAMSMLVLSAVAVAASTRLGQVMTIILCSGVFVFGLLSNYVLGRHAYDNRRVSVIDTAAPISDEQAAFTGRGDTYSITLRWPPDAPIRPGDSFYYGPSPGGADLAVPAFEPFRGDPSNSTEIFSESVDPGVIVTSVVSEPGTSLSVRNIGATPARVERAPRPGDHVFLTPTRVSAPALAAWAVLPNMQNFWLVDAVTQNSPIPPSHLGLVALYALGQISALLCLAVILFQQRDVG